MVSVLCLYALIQSGSPDPAYLGESTARTLVLGYGVFSLPLCVAYVALRAKRSDIVWPYYVVAALLGGFGYVAFLAMWGIEEITLGVVGALLFAFAIGCLPGLVILGIVHVLPRWLLWTLALPLPAASLGLIVGLALF